MGMKALKPTIRSISLPCRVGKVEVTSMAEEQQAWADLLISSVDGQELQMEDVDKDSNLWLKDSSRVFPRLHLCGILLRGGVLSTKARKCCGESRKELDSNCRGICRARETLNHILQHCEVTHDARCRRHNNVMHLLSKKLKRKGKKIWTEPIISTSTSFIKPDLILEEEKSLTIMDVSIVRSQRMPETWNLKIAKYGSKSEMDAIKTWQGRNVQIGHLPLIISSWGTPVRAIRRWSAKGRTDQTGQG